MENLSRGMAALLNANKATPLICQLLEAEKAQKLAKIRKMAADYRAAHYENGEPKNGGVIVVFQNETQGWVNELRNPESWTPGCVAVEEDGTCHIATGGDAYNGAECWTPINDTVQALRTNAGKLEKLAENIDANTPPRIGEMWLAQGGIYAGQMLYPNGELRHQIMHPDAIRAEWGGHGTEIEGANDNYDGAANTRAMRNSGLDLPIITALEALTAGDHHNDYHLPSIREQNLLTINLPHLLDDEWHWTSTQYSADYAWIQDCGYGNQGIHDKGLKLAARAVRSLLVIE